MKHCAAIFFAMVSLILILASCKTDELPEQFTEQWLSEENHILFEVGEYSVTLEYQMTESEGQSFAESVKISVWDKKNLSQPIQTMTKETDIYGSYEVVDANFDGSMDFGIKFFQGNQPNYWYYWIWDADTKQFVEEPEFQTISMPVFDAETEQIKGYARTGFAGLAGVSTIHKWVDGTLTCMRQIVSDVPVGEEEYVVVTVKDRIQDELTEVYRKEFPLDQGEEVFAIRDKWENLSYCGIDMK